jgi:hypothetical protein
MAEAEIILFQQAGVERQAGQSQFGSASHALLIDLDSYVQ